MSHLKIIQGDVVIKDRSAMKDLDRWIKNLAKRLWEPAMDHIHISNVLWMLPTLWNKNHSMPNVIWTILVSLSRRLQFIIGLLSVDLCIGLFFILITCKFVWFDNLYCYVNACINYLFWMLVWIMYIYNI